MKTVTGSTTSEKKMIKAIQTATGAIADGQIGTQTMSDIACLAKADCFPLTLQIYSQPVIIAKDFAPYASQGATITKYTNAISGSFLSGKDPCSVMIRDGEIISPNACHYWQTYPESVLYKLKDGSYGIKRVRTAYELPKGVVTAVGGMGLLDNYNPSDEGFKRMIVNGKSLDFSDVLRKTNHTMTGVKNGYVYLCYCKNMTAAQVNAYAQKLGLELAIMLDGGHVAAINGEESFAKINTSQKQYYIVKGE